MSLRELNYDLVSLDGPDGRLLVFVGFWPGRLCVTVSHIWSGFMIMFLHMKYFLDTGDERRTPKRSSDTCPLPMGPTIADGRPAYSDILSSASLVINAQ